MCQSSNILEALKALGWSHNASDNVAYRRGGDKTIEHKNCKHYIFLTLFGENFFFIILHKGFHCVCLYIHTPTIYPFSLSALKFCYSM